MPLPEGFAAIDFLRFHREQLPALMAKGRGQLAARAASRLGSLALRLSDGPAYTYQPRVHDVELTPGDERADTVIEMDLDSWQGLVHELEAPAGLLYAGRVRCARGNAVDLMAWESALRALYNGHPPYNPAGEALRDDSGQPLDAQQTFAFAAERTAMARFLRAAGYLFVRGVFGADEVAAFRVEAQQLQEEARRGDKLSWWGKNRAGEELLCRVTRGVAKPHFAQLPANPRVRDLKDLGGELLVYKRGEGQGVTVIFKRPGMVEGLGDLPWHRDCGMGGHAVMCPVLVISVYLTEATPETGELAMLPGSHRAAFNAHDPRPDITAHAAHFRARPGDVSVHFSDTVHAAPPPTDPRRATHRISAVLSFARPGAGHHRGESSYNDVLHQRDDGQIEHLEAVAKRM